MSESAMSDDDKQKVKKPRLDCQFCRGTGQVTMMRNALLFRPPPPHGGGKAKIVDCLCTVMPQDAFAKLCEMFNSPEGWQRVMPPTPN